MIAVLDYGSGNVRAFLNAYERLNVPCMAARSADEVAKADRIILPGVGAFDTALQQFENSGMKKSVEIRVIQEGIPLLGVCVGMQMLANSSDEGTCSGLGWIPATVRQLPAESSSRKLYLPHMGWNKIKVSDETGLLDNLPSGGLFYFLHSYFFDASKGNAVIARCQYGEIFPCAVRRNNIYAVQFHPEKSHDDGMKLLENFSNI